MTEPDGYIARGIRAFNDWGSFRGNHQGPFETG